MKSLVAMLEDDAAAERDERVAAATQAPKPWADIATAPKDGTLIDVKFEVANAEPGMAEFYAPGSTRRGDATEPTIENVVFANGCFAPVIDKEAAAAAIELQGGWGELPGRLYGIMSVTLTHWRPAAYPFI